MSEPGLQPLITVRRYRTVGQLIVEWILGLVAFFSLAAGLFGQAQGRVEQNTHHSLQGRPHIDRQGDDNKRQDRGAIHSRLQG